MIYNTIMVLKMVNIYSEKQLMNMNGNGMIDL